MRILAKPVFRKRGKSIENTVWNRSSGDPEARGTYDGKEVFGRRECTMRGRAEEHAMKHSSVASLCGSSICGSSICGSLICGSLIGFGYANYYATKNWP